MTDGQMKCCWCDKSFKKSDLKGPDHNRCPFCGDPVVPATFGSLTVGQAFSCKLGGSWTKISQAKAELQDADEMDEPCEFKVDEQVFPF